MIFEIVRLNVNPTAARHSLCALGICLVRSNIRLVLALDHHVMLSNRLVLGQLHPQIFPQLVALQPCGLRVIQRSSSQYNPSDLRSAYLLWLFTLRMISQSPRELILP